VIVSDSFAIKCALLIGSATGQLISFMKEKMPVRPPHDFRQTRMTKTTKVNVKFPCTRHEGV